MNDPLVSVLMPVYNAGRYVAEAVESILGQTFKDFEFIIIDDGSTDGSLAILERHATRDSRIRLVSRPNTGIVGALNEGLAMCRGEFIARMDADDLCGPRRFELQVRRLGSEPDLVALGSCAIAIDPDGNELGDAPVPLTHEEIEANHLRGISSIFHPSVMIRHEAVRAVGGYRDAYRPAEDLDLWLRLAEVGRLANLPEKLFIWRRTLDGVVASSLSSNSSVVHRVMEDTWRRRDLPGRPPIRSQLILTRTDLFRQWGWMALKGGNVRVSRKYARRALCRQPWSPSSWRLAYCSLRGR